MKSDNSTLVPKMTARQVTRSNQAWAVDFAVLDFAERPFVMLVADVGTRLPLSVTISLVAVEDIIIRLERLVRRSGRPEQIWMDGNLAYNTFLGDFHPALKAWAEDRDIFLTHADMLGTRSVAERILRDLAASLRDKRFSTLMELGHDLERWRYSYAAGARTIPTSTT